MRCVFNSQLRPEPGRLHRALAWRLAHDLFESVNHFRSLCSSFFAFIARPIGLCALNPLPESLVCPFSERLTSRSIGRQLGQQLVRSERWPGWSVRLTTKSDLERTSNLIFARSSLVWPQFNHESDWPADSIFALGRLIDSLRNRLTRRIRAQSAIDIDASPTEI